MLFFSLLTLLVALTFSECHFLYYNIIKYFCQALNVNSNRDKETIMFKNKSSFGKNNICGEKIYMLRKMQLPKMSQRILAEKLQLNGIDVDKNAIQRIESGQRFVTDIELLQIAKIFNVSCDYLLNKE